MLRYRDFVPKMTAAPGFLSAGEFESFKHAVEAANEWLVESSHSIRLINLETVVLPNIWSRYEEGSDDAALGTSGEAPSNWHQFLRVWYQDRVLPDPGDLSEAQATTSPGNDYMK